MDDNKKTELQLAGYVIRRCCGTCDSVVLNGAQVWGTCRVHQYEHGKHDGNPRQASVCTWGYCDRYTPDEMTMRLLGPYKMFLEESQ